MSLLEAILSLQDKGHDNVDFVPDRRAIARYGLRVADVLDTVETAIGGMVLSQTVEGRERYTINVRFGGVDACCRLKLVLSGMPSIVTEEIAENIAEAFSRALRSAEGALRHAMGKRARSARKRERQKSQSSSGTNQPRQDDGSLIGRRVGRSFKNLEEALARPEKRRRDVFVDTSAPSTSATDRKAGYGATAARNTKRRAPKASAALEDSRQKPSRKSTRKSANRQKAATALERVNKLRVHAPSEHAARVQTRNQRRRVAGR